MAKLQATGLGYKAKIDITDAKKNIAELKRILADAQVTMPSTNVTASSANFTQANNAMTRAIRDSMLETERLRQENLALQNQWQRGAITINELTARQRENTIARQQATAAARAARQAQVAVNGSYAEAQARLRALGDRIRSVEGGFNNLGRVQQARIAEYRQLNAQLTEFDRRMGNHGRNVGNYQSALRGVGGQLSGLVTTYLSAAAAIQLVGAAFTQSLKSAAVRTSLEFTFGSVDLADAKLEQLLDTANRLGVNYNALVSSYKSFTGAVVASNFDFQQGERIFNAVAGASSKLKLSADDTEGSLRALQQMISKGNVQAEELRGQLGERIPGAFSIAARAMKKTEADLNKMLQKGEVLAADLLPKLATELEKTFGLESTKAIEGLNAETEKFFNMFSGAVSESSNINKVFTTIVKGFNEIFGTIIKMVNSDSWSEFWTRLTIGSAVADTIKNISTATEQANKAIKNTLNVPADDAKKATFAYEELSLAYEKAAKALADYKNGVAKGTLKDGGDTTIQTLDNIVKVTKARMDAVKKLIPKAGAVTPEESAAEKAARLKAEREAERQLNAQRALQKKIENIRNEASRKTLTKDEEEVQAVRDKFEKIAEEVRLFNANPKNKLKVDGSGLEPAMKAQIVSIEYKQDTEKLKESLEIQKGIYEEYEAYKVALGKKSADERFGSEIDTSKKIADVLQDEYDKILAAGSKTGFTGAMTERMKALEGMIVKEAQIEQKRQDDLMKSIISFDTEVKALEEQYQKDRLDVLAKGGGKGLEVLDKNHADKLAAIGDAHLQEIEAFKELYAGIDRLSDENALKVLGNAEDALKALKAKGVVISKELEKELRLLFGDTRKAISDRLPERIIALANQIDSIASAVGNVDSGFGKLLGTLGNVVGQVGNIKKSMDSFGKDSKATGLEKLSAGLGIVGAGISIFKSITSFFDKSAQREAQAAYARELQNKQADVLNKSLERQIALINEAYGVKRIEQYTEALEKARANEKSYQDQLAGRLQLTKNKLLDELISKYNAGGIDIDKQKSVLMLTKQGEALYNGIKNGSLKTIDSLDINALTDLMVGGSLDEGTAKLVQNLIDAKKAAQDIANNLAAERIGAGLDTIVDEFMDGLGDGIEGVEDILTKSIRRGLLNALKGDITDKFLQDYYEMLDKALADGTISADEDALLKEQLRKADEYGKKRLDYINSAAPDVEADPQGLRSTGLTASMNQPTAERLEGLWRGQFDLTKRIDINTAAAANKIGELYHVASSGLLEMQQISANTLRMANNTERLAAIETTLASIDRKTIAEKSARA